MRHHRIVLSLALVLSSVQSGCGDSHADTLPGVDTLHGHIDSTALKWSLRTEAPNNAKALIVNDLVYFGNGDKHFYALDRETGRKAWAFKTRGWIHAAPAYKSGTIYVLSDPGDVFALDSKTGSKIWSIRVDAQLERDPVLADGVLYFGNRIGWNGKLFAIGRSVGNIN